MESLIRISLYYTVLLFYAKCGASFGTAVDESAMCDQLESGYWLPVTDSLFGIQNAFLRVKTQK